MTSASTDVCIVYNDDAKSWPEYIGKCCQPNIRFRHVADTELASPKQTARPALADSRAIIVIVSPGHLDFLFEQNVKPASGTMMYKDFSPENGLIFVCCEGGIDKWKLYCGQDGKPRATARRPTEHFPEHERWTQINYDISADDISTAVDELLLRAGRKKAGKRPSLSDKPQPTQRQKPVPDAVASEQPRRAFQTVEIHPTTARSEEPTWIVLSFSTEVQPDAKVEILLADDVDSLALSEPIVTRRLNPYTYTFETPEHVAGDVCVRVRVDGRTVSSSEQGQGETLTLTYTAELSGIFNDVSQIYMHLLTTMCNQLIGGGVGGGGGSSSGSDVPARVGLSGRPPAPLPPSARYLSVEALDAKLSSLFDLENPPADIPTVGFEQLFAIYRHINAATSTQTSELPTLIHFAAKFGLAELCNKLTDLPDADMAVCLPNSKNELPHIIARDNRHADLDIFLQDFLDTALYCNQNRVHYWNTNLVPNDESYYVSMDKQPAGPTGPRGAQPIYVAYDNGDIGEDDETYVAMGGDYDVSQIDVKMPANQRKLVEIRTKVQNKEITQAQADKEIKQWQYDQQKGAHLKSFKDKKELLSKMRRDMQCSTKHAVTHLRGPAAAMAAAPVKLAIPAACNSPGNRISNSSISSRESVLSNRSSRSSAMSTGYSSGFDSAADASGHSRRVAPPVPKRN